MRFIVFSPSPGNLSPKIDNLLLFEQPTKCVNNNKYDNGGCGQLDSSNNLIKIIVICDMGTAIDTRLVT